MTSDELLEMARLAGCGWAENGTKPMLLGEKQLERFAALVAAHEREQCAVACGNLQLAHAGRADLTADQCADAIRARGNNEPT